MAQSERRPRPKSGAKASPKVLSVAFIADDEKSLQTIKKAITDAVAGIAPQVSDGWTQSGGWVREQDGWPQSGGWYLSKNRQKTDESLPPLEESLKDVLATFQKVQAQAEQAG